MRLFKNADAIAAEIESMENDELNRRSDRATVSNFFNGAPPLTDDEAEEAGLSINVNNLFGYTELAAARDQTMALYNKPARLFEISLRDAPAIKRFEWGIKATKECNDIIKQSGRLKMPYEGVAGDCVMHGVGNFFFPNATDWCPVHLTNGKLLIPTTASADPRELTHFAIDSQLTLRDLFFYRRFQTDGWKQNEIDSIIRKLVEQTEKEGSPERETISRKNVEELAYLDQTGAAVGNYYRAGIQVYYFFQVDPDRIGEPVDLTILAKYKPLDDNGTRQGKETNAILFDLDCFYFNVLDCIQPFFMDCIIGGTSNWHRVMGLGTLNYSLNYFIEMLLCSAMQSTLDGTKNFWQVSDAGSREALQQIMLKHNGIIPEGVTFAAGRPETDYTGVLNMIQFYRNQGSKNAASQSPAANLSEGRKKLQVEVLREQGQTGAAQQSRIANWYDYEDRLYSKIFEKFTNPFIRPSDKGYSEICAFQGAMQRLGIPLYYLQPHNVIVRASRIIGNGNEQDAKQTAAFLTQNRQIFPPQSQQKISRIVTAIATGDYALAEELVPIQETPDATQIMHANTDENTCLEQGRPPQVTDMDVDSIHVSSHFQALAGLLQAAVKDQNSAFDAKQIRGFKALGAHIAAHAQKVGMMGDKETMSKWMSGLAKFAAMGDKLANNFRQTNQQQQLDPETQAKLQLDAAELQRKMRKDQFSEAKFQTTQQFREHKEAVDTHLAIERNLRDEAAHKQQLMLNDIETAKGLIPSNDAPRTS